MFTSDGSISSRYNSYKGWFLSTEIFTLLILLGLIFPSAGLVQNNESCSLTRLSDTETFIYQTRHVIITKTSLTLYTTLYGTDGNDGNIGPSYNNTIRGFVITKGPKQPLSFSQPLKSPSDFQTIGNYLKGWNMSSNIRSESTNTEPLPVSSVIGFDSSNGTLRHCIDHVRSRSDHFVSMNLSSLEIEDSGHNIRSNFRPTSTLSILEIPQIIYITETMEINIHGDMEDLVGSSTRVGYQTFITPTEERLDVTGRYPFQLGNLEMDTVHASTKILQSISVSELHNSSTVKYDTTVTRHYRSDTRISPNQTGILMTGTIPLSPLLLSPQNIVTFTTSYTKTTALINNITSTGSVNLSLGITTSAAVTNTDLFTSNSLSSQGTTSNTTTVSIPTGLSSCSVGNGDNLKPNITYQVSSFPAPNFSKSDLSITGPNNTKSPSMELPQLSQSLLTITLNTSTTISLETVASTSTTPLSEVPNNSMSSRTLDSNSLSTQSGIGLISESDSPISSASGAVNISTTQNPKSTSDRSASVTKTTTDPVSTTGCMQCLPYAGTIMSCDITTSCINVTENTQDTRVQYYCACRRRFKASGMGNDSSLHFRLPVWDYDDIVFTAPGVVCNTLCDSHSTTPGEICEEVNLRKDC